MNTRESRGNVTDLADLGLLGELEGAWEGTGFNLIARPNFQAAQNLYLELNPTHEILQINAIGSEIPNRGFGQDDIELFGLTYLQRITDTFTGGALHIEPGLWVTQPPTSYPAQDSPTGSQIVARMGSIPHGNAILAQGTVQPFDGVPVLAGGGQNYVGSQFPSFNSTPFGIAPPPVVPAPLVAIPPLPVGTAINAATSSEALTAPALIPPGVPFAQYDFETPATAANQRSPFGEVAAPGQVFPSAIDGVPMQTLINDPIALLQAIVRQQVDEGHKFEGVAINIASQDSIAFLNSPNDPTGPSAPTAVIEGAGGIENILFLEGGNPVGPNGPNLLD